MTERLNVNRVALSLAITFGFISLLCIAGFALIPSLALTMGKELFHGIDITLIARPNISLLGTAAGFIEAMVLGYVMGWVFGTAYNSFK